MNQPPTVSVVVPIYNATRYLAECIESVREQTFSDWELLLVDDGSSDNSAEIARIYARQDRRIRLLYHPRWENRGVSRTRQLGIESATGRYVALLDADDAFEPEKLARQVAELERRSECVLCHAAVHVNDETRSGIARRLEMYHGTPAAGQRVYRLSRVPDLLKQNRICLSTTLIRADALRSVPLGFTQLYQHEDWTLMILLGLQGPFCFLSNKLVRYRVHASASQTQVRRNPLVRQYSRVEFLLSILALVEDDHLRADAQRELSGVLAETMGIYAGRRWAMPEVARERLARAVRRLLRLPTSLSWRLAGLIGRFRNKPVKTSDDGLTTNESQPRRQAA